MSFLFRHSPARSIAGTIFLAAAVGFAAVGTARAATMDDLKVEGWYGSGVNRTALVVDFSAGTDTNDASDSFAFGWNFNGDSITVYDLMCRIHEANSNFEFTAEYSGVKLGYWIDSITYTTGGKKYTGEYYWDNDNLPGSLWWAYYLSDNVGETWDYAMLGVSFQPLANGEIVGFLATAGNDYTSTPVAPVPEPSTLALAAIGFAALFAWRRRRG